MLQPEWTDYGHWKNWVSPWGEIGIEKRPYHCDRGRVAIKTLTHGGANKLFNPLLSNAYFFSEKRAEQHLKLVTELAEKLTDEQIRALSLELTSLTQTFQGKDCICELTVLLLKPEKITVWAFTVKVNPGKEDTLHIDDADMFPRYYLDHSIALAEVKAWMEERSQGA